MVVMGLADQSHIGSHSQRPNDRTAVKKTDGFHGKNRKV